MQIKPSDLLADIVKHYLILDNDEPGNYDLRLFSDGNTGIVFSSGNLFSSDQYNNTLYRLPQAFFYGQISRFKNISCHGKMSVFIVVFHPHGLNQLLKLHASELIDEIAPVKDLFGNAGASLADAVLNSVSVTEKILFIEQFLINILATQHYPGDNMITAVISYILRSKGQIRANQMVHFSGYNLRQLERRFKTVTGLNPKRFANIVRLHSFLNFIKTNPGMHIGNCGLETGYYDQPHLIREFKNITGLTPEQYTNGADLLAVNFLKIKQTAIST